MRQARIRTGIGIGRYGGCHAGGVMTGRLLALAFATFLVTTAPCQEIYRCLSEPGTPAFPTEIPRYHIGEGMSLLDPGPGRHWHIDNLGLRLAVLGETNFASIHFDVTFWNQWNEAGFEGPGSRVFRSKAGEVSFDLHVGPTSGDVTFFGFAHPSTSVAMSAFQNVGIEISVLADGQPNPNVTLGIVDHAPTAGTSTNLYYNDVDSSGFIETTDGRTVPGWSNANLNLYLGGRSLPGVPEPASMAVLGAGLLGLLFRRSR